MPARSKSQQRLFGMLHAYNKGEFSGSRSLKKKLFEMSKHISDEDAKHFAETKHKDLPEKKASAKISIQDLYNAVKKRYSDMGYDIKGDRLSISSQPTYMNGKPVPASVMKSNASGGNIQDNGTIRINPAYRKVMRHWKLKGSGRDFLNAIIGHELGHHIDRTILSSPEHAEERKRLLKEIIKRKFHTVYTDIYGPDTDPRKLDKELLAEYLSKKVNEKKASHGAFIDLLARYKMQKRAATHTVASGNTLSGIAKQYGSTVQGIQTENNITDPNKIRIGQILKIPAKKRAPVIQTGVNAVAAELHKQFNNPRLEAAILANIDRETGGTFNYRTWQSAKKQTFNSKVKQTGGYGLFQLTGKSLSDYKNWLNKRKAVDSMANQISFVKSVYGPKRTGWKKNLLATGLTREQLADWWHRRVETPDHVIPSSKYYSPT